MVSAIPRKELVYCQNWPQSPLAGIEDVTCLQEAGTMATPIIGTIIRYRAWQRCQAQRHGCTVKFPTKRTDETEQGDEILVMNINPETFKTDYNVKNK